MKIRKATKSDITTLLKITKACANAMIAKNIFQWNDEYPSFEAFEIDVKRKELYVLEDEKSILGCITISTFMDEEYKPVQWLTENNNNIYIHRLAVDPNHQKKGFAKKMMDFAEDFAKKNNFLSVRLDTFSVNERNNAFYKNRRYKKTGEIFFPRQSNFSFYCYELVL